MARGPRGAGLLEAAGQETRDAARLLAHAPARTGQEAEKMEAAAQTIDALAELHKVSVHDAATAVLDLAAAQDVRPQVRVQAHQAIAELLASIARARRAVGGEGGKDPNMELGSTPAKKGRNGIEL